MPDIPVEPTPVAEWRSLVRAAGEACDTTLDEAVEAYMVFMLMRFTEHADLGAQALAVRWLEGMQADDAPAAHERLQATADECLLVCGLFPQRLRRRAVPFSYYVDLGRGAYHTLACRGAATDGPWDELARGFVRLMELLQAMRERDPDAAALGAGEAATLAHQTGSRRAWDRVAPDNVTLLDAARRRRHFDPE